MELILYFAVTLLDWSRGE